MPRLLRRLLNRRATRQHDQIRQRHLLTTRLRRIELRLDHLQNAKHLAQLLRLVHFPFPLRQQPNPRPIRPAPLVAPSERRCRSPRCRHQLSHCQTRSQYLCLQRIHIRLLNQRMIHCRHRILPNQRLLRHQRPQITRQRPHVPMRQLEPRLRKRVRKLLRMLMEPLRDLMINRIFPQRDVRREHHRRMPLRRIMRVRHRALTRSILRRPLPRPRRTLRQLPLIRKQVREIPVRPRRRTVRPRPFQPARDRVTRVARAIAVLPAQPLLFKRRPFRLRPHVALRRRRAMRLPKRVPPGDQCHRLLIVHRHPRKRLANVPRRRQRIRPPVRTFRIHINQSHLHRRQRIRQMPIPTVALVSQPLTFRPPINILLRLPHIRPPTRKPEGLKSHRLQRHVPGQHHQVRPGNLVAILLLDRPQQPPRLVQIAIVRPAVQRRKPQRPKPRSPATIRHPIRPRTVPRHPNKERTIMPVIRRPPCLRRRHQLLQILPHRLQIQLLKRLRIIKITSQRIPLVRVLMQNLQVQLLRPPVAIRHGSGGSVALRTRLGAHHRALADVFHGVFSSLVRVVGQTRPSPLSNHHSTRTQPCIQCIVRMIAMRPTHR